MIYIGNAFSLQMLSNLNTRLITEEIDFYNLCNELLMANKDEIMSCIGHETTSLVVQKLFSEHLPEGYSEAAKFNRISIKLKPQDTLVVFQYSKGRLSEGVVLEDIEPDDFKIIRVHIL